MYKLDLEKAEEPEIKLPTFAGSWRKQENSRKFTMLKLCVDHNKLCEILKRYGDTRPLYCLLRNLYADQGKSWNWTWNNGLVPNWERSTSRLYTVTLLI